MLMWCAAELSCEKGRQRFLYAETNLAEPGELFRNSTYEFAFDAKKPHESYTGTNVQLRYVAAMYPRSCCSVPPQPQLGLSLPTSVLPRSRRDSLGVGLVLRVLSVTILFIRILNENNDAAIDDKTRDSTDV